MRHRRGFGGSDCLHGGLEETAKDCIPPFTGRLKVTGSSLSSVTKWVTLRLLLTSALVAERSVERDTSKSVRSLSSTSGCI